MAAYQFQIAGQASQRSPKSSGGIRADLGIYVRSSWEGNYCRYLNFMKGLGEIVSWEYEPQTFRFAAIQRGTQSYTPDFKVVFPDGHYEWHEVKGWMDAKSQTKLKRMAKYYPTERIVIIDKAWFAQARRSGLSRMIPHWEGRPR